MNKKERVVVDQSGITADQMKDFWRKVSEGTIDKELFDYFQENSKKIRQQMFNDILGEILTKEHKAHYDFFGREFDLSSFENLLIKHGLEAIKNWKGLGLEPHYLPPISMPRDMEISGWGIRPEEWYYQKIADGKILRRQLDDKLTPVEKVELEGITVLIDTRLKPKYRDGKQMFKNDNLLGPIIEKLRKEGKIAKYEYGDQASRFGVSSQEWQEHIRPALAKEFGVEAGQVRLETVPEANAIPQIYPHMPRHKDGETNTWVWYEEYFGGVSRRLDGGRSVFGGLADVDCRSVGSRWHYRAVRPLVVLS